MPSMGDFHLISHPDEIFIKLHFCWKSLLNHCQVDGELDSILSLVTYIPSLVRVTVSLEVVVSLLTSPSQISKNVKLKTHITQGTVGFWIRFQFFVFLHWVCIFNSYFFYIFLQTKIHLKNV